MTKGEAITKKEEFADLSLDEIASEVAKKLRGGKAAMSDEEYLPIKDYEHEKELEKLSANAEKKEAEYQQAIETLSNQLKEALDPNHRKHCVGGECQVNQVHSQIFQEGVEKGRFDTLANLKFEDVTPKFIGDWLRAAREREKEGK